MSYLELREKLDSVLYNNQSRCLDDDEDLQTVSKDLFEVVADEFTDRPYLSKWVYEPPKEAGIYLCVTCEVTTLVVCVVLKSEALYFIGDSLINIEDYSGACFSKVDFNLSLFWLKENT